jgi:hypothetical protein
LVLLSGGATNLARRYLWLVYGTIGGAADQQVERIEAFGARRSDRRLRGVWALGCGQ